MDMEEHIDLLYRAQQMLKSLGAELDESEQKDLKIWLDAHAEHAHLMDRILADKGMEDELSFFSNTGRNTAWIKLKGKIEEVAPAPHKIKLWPSLFVAASIVLLLSIGLWLYRPMVIHGLFNHSDFIVNDIAPGKSAATLTLSNGHIMQLNESKTGVVVNASGLKYNDGSIVEQVDPNVNQVNEVLTATTPRAGTYQFTLSDGTKVWLNADSKLKFASNLKNAKQRIVELTGEAYFEVAPVYRVWSGQRIKQPFLVKTSKQEVQVLGTHFNISSYADEANTKTTLLEGSVKVSSILKYKNNRSDAEIKHKDVFLKPGQQSILTEDDRIVVNVVDVAQAVAWKNSLFIFDHDDLEHIMKKISRWYDVDIVFLDESAKKELFSGRISCFEHFSEVLKKLSLTGAVKFKIEGRRILITK